MQTRDELIGANLQRVRQAVMTQQALADAMKEQGWKWSQATVWSIEKGERPLRMSEAVDIVSLLDLEGVGELITTPLVTIGWQRMSAVAQAERDLARSASEFMFHQFRLAATCDRIVTEGLSLPIVSDGDEDIEGYLNLTPEEVVETVTLRQSPERLQEANIPADQRYMKMLMRANPAAVSSRRLNDGDGEHQAEA